MERARRLVGHPVTGASARSGAHGPPPQHAAGQTDLRRKCMISTARGLTTAHRSQPRSRSFRSMNHRPPQLALAVACLWAFAAAGCFRSSTRVRVPPVVAPAAASPQHAVDLLRWCWEHRAVSDYRGLFADDYRFGFPADSAGNPVRVRELTREEELAAATNLFAKGTATLPPARRIAVVFDPNLIARPDSRPGREPRWHREVVTTCNLMVDTPAIVHRIT